jgi:septal ring factor EnvC (AmiA/AmiB activator)
VSPPEIPALDLPLLELATENAELRLQLAEAQDQLIEMAVDAGELQALIEGLRAELAEARAERDAWRVQPTRIAS